jgi:hypothetical protein
LWNFYGVDVKLIYPSGLGMFSGREAELDNGSNITSFIFNSFSGGTSSTPCLCCEGVVLSFVDFQGLVVKHSSAFAAWGLVSGDAVLIATGRGNDFWIDVFAAWRWLPFRSSRQAIRRCCGPLL